MKSRHSRIASRRKATDQAKQKNLRVFCCFIVLAEERLKESENLLEKLKALFEALNDVTDSKHGISSLIYLAILPLIRLYVNTREEKNQ